MRFTINQSVAAFLACVLFYSTQAQDKLELQAKTNAQIMQMGVDMISRANQAEISSGKKIIASNKIRKQVNKVRAQRRKLTDAKRKKELETLALSLGKEMEAVQNLGAKLREDSIRMRKDALRLFETGFSERWKPWVQNREPLTLDDTVTRFLAHNAKIRSVHPTMLNKMGSANANLNTNTSGNNTSDNNDEGNNGEMMSLSVPVLVAQKAPPDLDISAFQLSRDQHYFAHIEVQPTAEIQPDNVANVSAIPLNQMHKWRLIVSDLLGNPIANANIDLQGHMPGHVHGLPTQPQVTQELTEGVYLVEGVKFQMKGWWVIQFHIDANTSTVKRDTLTFNLVL